MIKEENRKLALKILGNKQLITKELNRVLKYQILPLLVYKQYYLNEEQINKAMEIGNNLDCLYKHNYLNEKQINNAIEIGKCLVSLLEYNKLTEYQKKKIEKIKKNE